MASLGDDFRAAREARHLSLSDVAEQIHIRSVYLQGIENEDWASIAAPVYVRGFLRAYARFLGMDPEEAVQRYNEVLGDDAVIMPAMPYRADRGPSVWIWIAGAAAALLVAYVGYNYYQYRASRPAIAHGAARPSATPAVEATARVAESPTTAPSRAPSPSSPPARGVVVQTTQDSWMSVSVDGKPVLEALVPAGSTKTFTGKTVAIRAGNAGGVNVTVAGKPLGVLGAPGAVVDRTFTP